MSGSRPDRDLPADPPAPLSGSNPGPAPLAGFTIAVADERRRSALAPLLESVGARTVTIQAVRAVPQPDPEVLRAATQRCLATDRCDEVVVSSQFGLRSWLAAARSSGALDALVTRLAGARLLARDPPAADSLRALGLTTVWSTAGATTEELLRYLAAQPLAGRQVTVQLDRDDLGDACEHLRDLGAEVVEVPTYRAQPPPHAMILRRLVDLVIHRQVDAVAFVAASTAGYLLAHAEREGRLGDLLAALSGDVSCLALGPRAAGPLRQLAVPVVLAARPYLADLAEQALAVLPGRSLTLAVRDHRLELRGRAVVLDGRLIALPGGPLAVLRALAQHPGRVLSAAEIRGRAPLWSDVDDHAVEMAVSRLRRLLGGGEELVQTIMKRGYRLVT